ncbi:MAG: PepSY domain-containing protein [Pseudomonadales bacterium]
MKQTKLNARSLAKLPTTPPFLAVLALSLLMLLPLSGTVLAQRNAQQGSNDVSSGQAANIARAATGGKVLSVSPAGNTYKVKVLKNNGVVTSVRVDRTTGKVQR